MTRRWWFRTSRDDDLKDEIESHFRMAVADWVARGEDVVTARKEVGREFGNRLQVEEATRAMWPRAATLPRIALDHLSHDVRLGVRSLARHPGLTVLALATCAVGIGTTSAIYSVVKTVLLSEVPYPNPDRIVRVAATVRPKAHLPAFSGYGGRGNEANFSDRGYWLFAGTARSFAAFGGYRPLHRRTPIRFDGLSDPVDVVLAQMTATAFRVLGIAPQLGRLPSAEEDLPNGPRVALISHRLWATRFGSDTTAVGRTIEQYGLRTTIIGVLPPRFDFPTPNVDLWVPLQLDPASEAWEGHNLAAIARLAPGVSVSRAEGEARALVARFTEIGYSSRWLANVFDGNARVWTLKEDTISHARRPLLVALGAAGLLLLVACSSVAMLLFARAGRRARETSVRLALGSGRGRIFQQALIESLLLGFAGGALGLGLAYLAIGAIVAFGPDTVPRLHEVGMQGPVLSFVVAASFVTALVFGTLPAVKSASLELVSLGGRGSTGHVRKSRAPGILVAVQVAIALVLLVATSLMVRTFDALRTVDPGFDATHTLTLEVKPLPEKYPNTTALVGVYDRLRERLSSIPNVVAVGGVDHPPMTERGFILRATVGGAPSTESGFPPTFVVRRVTAGYFDALRVPILEGRPFAADEKSAAAVVVSESVKRKYWPHEPAVGKRIRIEEAIDGEVVGVAGDVHDVSPDTPPDHTLYLPATSASLLGAAPMSLILRTDGARGSIGAAVREAIRDVDPTLPVGDLRPMSALLARTVGGTTFTMILLLIGAGISLILASTGIYGVTSHLIQQRRAEITIRLALGATPLQVRWAVVLHGLTVVGAGVLIGLIAVAFLGAVLDTLLFGVGRFDAVSLLVSMVAIFIVATAALARPAKRASQVDLASALWAD